MWTMKNVFILLSFIVTSLNNQSMAHLYHFVQEKIPSLQLGGEFMSDNTLPYNTEEERRKLCFYAKNAAGLQYIDLDYVPRWQKYTPTSPQDHPFQYGMYCKTLPSMYLLLIPEEKYFQITFVQSSVTQYQFDRNHVTATSVSPDKEGNINDGAAMPQWSDEDRRNLCIAAREYVPLIFFDTHIAEVQAFQFDLPGGKETNYAFPCPSLPRLYICGKKESTELKLILIKSVTDKYKMMLDGSKPISVNELPGHESSAVTNELMYFLPEERKNMCVLARKAAWSPFEDTEVPEAQLYKFQYLENHVVQDVALQCPRTPLMYLRLDNSVQEENRVKVTFLQHEGDHHGYELDVVDYVYETIRDTAKQQELTQQMEGHLFTTLDEEGRWNFCAAAQRQIPRNVQVPLLPQYIGQPKMYEFAVYAMSTGRRLTFVDIAIRCSKYPELLVRLKKSNNQMKVVMVDEQFKALRQ